MVCRRADQSFLQLPRPPRADGSQEQGCSDLGERTRRSSYLHLPAALEGSAEIRQRSQVAGRPQRRSRRHLHGDDAGVADCHAGLRAHRSAALGGVWRILIQRADRSHSRFPGGGSDHAGRLVPPRCGSEAIPSGRRGAQVLSVGEARGGVQAHRNCHQPAGRTRSLVARVDGQSFRRLSCRAARLRTSALHSLYVWYDREAQGSRSHHRRILGRDSPHYEVCFRSEGRRHLLVHRRYRMGHRP